MKYHTKHVLTSALLAVIFLAPMVIGMDRIEGYLWPVAKEISTVVYLRTDNRVCIERGVIKLRDVRIVLSSWWVQDYDNTTGGVYPVSADDPKTNEQRSYDNAPVKSPNVQYVKYCFDMPTSLVGKEKVLEFWAVVQYDSGNRFWTVTRHVPRFKVDGTTVTTVKIGGKTS
jgi:hypothetical protein